MQWVFIISNDQTNHTETRSITSVNGLKIVLAEDNFINQKVTSQLLEKLGCNVTIVENGVELLAMAQQGNIDIVFMDMRMPEMDGVEATRRLRSQDPHRPYIIAVTANALDKDREACLSAGMQDFLPKPIDLEILRGALDRYFEYVEVHRF